MPRFRYSFLRPDGAVVSGAMDVADEVALAAKLQKENCYLLRAGPERPWLAWLSGIKLNIGRPSMVLVLHELGSLVKGGLPVDRGLTIVAEMLPEVGLKATLVRMRDAVRRGSMLGDAMEQEPAYFSGLHVNLVRAGEMGATLDDALLRLADYLRQQDTLRGQVLTALIYPAILLLVGVAALILLATVVLPQLAPIFADAGRRLPLATRLILAGAQFFREFGWFVGIVLVGLVVATRQTLKNDKQRARWDRLKLRSPLVGPIILAIQTARFARTTGALLKSGVALPTALGLSRQTISNYALREALRVVTIEVRGGRSLTAAMHRVKIFPPLSAQLISVGEETGHLNDMLLHQAEIFERNSARRIETLIAILVPAMTIFIGSAVAGVLASILLAVMQLNELAS